MSTSHSSLCTRTPHNQKNMGPKLGQNNPANTVMVTPSAHCTNAPRTSEVMLAERTTCDKVRSIWGLSPCGGELKQEVTGTLGLAAANKHCSDKGSTNAL